MATTATIEVQGLETLELALRNLEEGVRGPILEEALFAAGEVLRRGIVEKLHSRSGRTAHDVRVEVQINAAEIAGAAGIGGTTGKGNKGGRGHILRFLERGAAAHVIPRQTRAFRRAGRGRKMLSFLGKAFVRVNHPGIRAQAPMRLTIASHGPASITQFGKTAWEGIRRTVEAQAA
jgi:hypothetical protein